MSDKRLIPAAGYLRMSSDQQDTSIDDQRSELIGFAAKRGFQIVRWYADEGVSGWKSKQRQSFLSLIADAASGEFKLILCWDQSRFSRFDPMEANFYWHQVRQAGVSIETIQEGKLDFESLGGWLCASVTQQGKLDYAKSVGRAATRGRRNSILAGRWCFVAPYGYRIQNGKLAFDDARKVETVRRIFRMRVNGAGPRVIIKALNADGIPGPQGDLWTTQTVKQLLGRDTYRGHTM